MKKGIRKVKVVFLAVALLLTGCGASEKEGMAAITQQPVTSEQATSKMSVNEVEKEYASIRNYQEYYNDIVERYYALISSGKGDFEYNEGEIGIDEYLNWCKPDIALERIGYAVSDLSGDGVPELIIGEISDWGENDEAYGSTIFALYNGIKETPELLLESWSRSCYQLLNDSDLYYSGSSGAMCSSFGCYKLSKNADSLQCNNYYYTAENANNPLEIEYYHNTTGISNKNVSEKLYNENIFWLAENDMIKNIGRIELSPFSTKNPLHVDWADEKTTANIMCEDYNLDNSDAQAKVILTTTEKITDLKVVALTFENCDDYGNIEFSEQEKCQMNELTPEKGIVLGITFFGSIPNYGVVYTDSNGNEHHQTIYESGRDGSILLGGY